MKRKELLNAMDDIPEVYLDEAISYKKKQRKRLYPLMTAACLAILLLTGLPQYTAKAVMAEVKQQEVLALEEAVQLQPLGAYFPAELPVGYTWLEDGIVCQRSGVDVLTGQCRNTETGDILTITVSVQSYFGIQTWNIVESVRNGEEIGSQLFMDFGDYAVQYHSERSKLNEMDGFDEMYYSASVHKPKSGGYRMVTSGMYDPIEESDVLIHLSLDAENMTARQSNYPLSYLFEGTYSLEDHKLIVEMKDNNNGNYRFTYTVISGELLVLETIAYDEKAAYGEWIEAHIPLESVLYRQDLWSDTNKKEDQY